MELLTIKQASKWASDYLNQEVSPTNISYLLQYGKIGKLKQNGSTLIDINELKKYYSESDQFKLNWTNALGDDLNWRLSFAELREKDTTKHVHRIHPYKGKFIPQLVEYFLDTHTDSFKKETFFQPGDIVLDPFVGSGTTLVQAAELGIHAVGIDVSRFNCMISKVKVQKNHFKQLKSEIARIVGKLEIYDKTNNIESFEAELGDHLSNYNLKNFPRSNDKKKNNDFDTTNPKYTESKLAEFIPVYKRILKKYGFAEQKPLSTASFLEKWYCQNIRNEILYCNSLIDEISDEHIKNTLQVILSRTMRSSRATAHYDLATLKEPKYSVYYCWKHKKLCKPLYSMKSWFRRYANDTLSRLIEFDNLRVPSEFAIFSADSRKVDIFKEVYKVNSELSKIMKTQKIRGIFTSPPYVGQINYHEQHAYSYELFGFDRKDELEIGPLFKGQGKSAQKQYIEGISTILNNSKQFLQNNFDIFLVANDKHNLYPEIAEKSKLKIVNQFKRPVLNRTERDRNPYSEIIFHMQGV